MDSLIVTQHCQTSEPWAEIFIDSESVEGKVYKIVIPWPDDKPSDFVCECQGYIHRGKCKHQEMASDKLCRWTQLVGPEIQTKQQEKDRICPRCGGPTTRTTEWQIEP